MSVAETKASQNKSSKDKFNIYEWIEHVQKLTKREEAAFPFSDEVLTTTARANLDLLKKAIQRDKNVR